MPHIGIVVIGRNEGERLAWCLAALAGRPHPLVYVDSGSTDDSLAIARSAGAVVVQLDLTSPPSAARARNEGFRRLLSADPTIDYVQFVDGDCHLAPGWLGDASRALDADEQLAIVCGRLGERSPQLSIYNRLCEMDWNGPPGPIKSSGGIFMARARAFDSVGGMDAGVVAGEEADLCVRLRGDGWTVRRLDADMGTHDAAMTHFGQWWKRTVRTGHSYAEGAWLHRKSEPGHNAREVRSILFWGLLVPLLAIAPAAWTWGLSLLLLGGYALLWARIVRHRLRGGDGMRDGSLYATFCVLGKFAQAMGVIQYLLRRRLLGRRPRVIEYKTVPACHP